MNNPSVVPIQYTDAYQLGFMHRFCIYPIFRQGILDSNMPPACWMTCVSSCSSSFLLALDSSLPLPSTR